MFSSPLSLSLLSLLASQVQDVTAAISGPGSSTYKWPNRLVEEIEHLLIDTSGFNSGNFAAGVTPNSLYWQGPQTLGRETVGQWIRVAFHDFATADVLAGTGGIDASIGFETNRPENSGSAMNDSLSYWKNFVNKHATMSDMIALGTTMATVSCDGPAFPLKAGRIDATQAGPLGVPEPDTSITDTLAQFKKNGMSQAEAIQLTACGHTIGRVHNGGFPQVVGPEFITPNNTGGGAPFDDTYTTFDNHVVTGYLDGTTSNQLVISFNESSRSDLRLYISDNNATMQDLATSNQHFLDTCVDVMTKQLNTVPKGVVLQNVAPIAVKPVNVQVSVDQLGRVIFSGAIRLLGTKFSPNSARTVAISVVNRDGSHGPIIATTPATPTTSGSSLYLGGASTYFFPFSATLPAAKGISGFTITVRENAKDIGTLFNNGGTYTVQDTAVWVPANTTTTVNTGANTEDIQVVAAVLKSFNAKSVQAQFSIPVPIPGTQSPRISTSSITLTRVATPSSYLYDGYFGTFTISTLNNTNTRSTFDIVATNSHGVQAIDDFRKLSTLGSS